MEENKEIKQKNEIFMIISKNGRKNDSDKK